MPKKGDDGRFIGISQDHNLVNMNNISNINTGMGTTIKGIEVLSADEAEFTDIKINGSLNINGKIHAEQIEMNETQVILNIDYDKVTEYMKNMITEDLQFFIRHLHKLKLMGEKELLDRS